MLPYQEGRQPSAVKVTRSRRAPVRPTPLILTFKRFLSVFLRFLKITVTPVIPANPPEKIRADRVTAAAPGAVMPRHEGQGDSATVRKTSEGRERRYHAVREGGWMIHERFFPVRFR
jgi:hypothetical protein